MKSLLLKSYAKINICLNVVGKRKDGYHELDMIMLPLKLHDSILFTELPNAKDHFVTIDDFSLGLFKYNIATTSIEKMQAKYGFSNKFRITIHKVIPMQSGLGGGSSNAGVVINAVNSYLKLNLPYEELVALSTGLGADIPFFLTNKPARCTGIGEKVEFINVKNDYYVLLVKPEAGCSTQGVYEVSDKMDLPLGDVEKVKEALETGDDDLLAKSIFNALEQPAISLVPEIQVIKDKLKLAGLKIVQMTGSGSCVFALSTDKHLINSVAKQLENQYLVEVTKVLK
ncbi:MAG: 4-(cytidine 5'-diphospho)-2-C-methyl-D-erythritol kinase [Bacilli bacterium]|nr:4-(cytidine 5'-diphospho)-2-C-methyl-D-erythritol kinase [Bacilli bacterium]